MKKTIVFLSIMAFLGFILFSATALADKDPKKQKVEKSKTHQCDQNSASAADAKSCCEKGAGKTCTKACSDTTSRASEMKACCNNAEMTACNKQCCHKSDEAACSKTCNRKASADSTAGCAKSGSCEHK